MHIPYAYTIYIYHIHLPCTCTMCMYHVHAPCTCTMCMYHVPCAYTIYIKSCEKYMLDPFSYIKYDEKCILELFLTVLELQNHDLLMFSLTSHDILYNSGFKSTLKSTFRALTHSERSERIREEYDGPRAPK